MNWLPRVCTVALLGVLLARSPLGNAYVLSADPVAPTVGDPVSVTLTGDLSAIAFLMVRVGYDAGLLGAQLPADALTALDDGVAGKPDAFAFYDNVAAGAFDYLVVAGASDLGVTNAAILSIPFATLGVGTALVTVSTCAATALESCDPTTPEFAGSFANELRIQIGPRVGPTVPEPGSLPLALASLAIVAAMLRRARGTDAAS